MIVRLIGGDACYFLFHTSSEGLNLCSIGASVHGWRISKQFCCHFYRDGRRNHGFCFYIFGIDTHFRIWIPLLFLVCFWVAQLRLDAIVSSCYFITLCCHLSFASWMVFPWMSMWMFCTSIYYCCYLLNIVSTIECRVSQNRCAD